MTQNELETALYNWATSILGATIPVIWAYQNMPRPSDFSNGQKAIPYVSFNLKTDTPAGGSDHVSRAYENTDEKDNLITSVNITGNREITLYCQSFGNNSSDFLKKLRVSLGFPTVQNTLRESGIVFVEQLLLSNVPALVESRWEDRNVMDLLFRYAEVGQDVNAGCIETVNFKETVKFGDSEIVKNESVTIIE